MLWRISTMNLQLYGPIKSGYGYIEVYNSVILHCSTNKKGLSTVLTVG